MKTPKESYWGKITGTKIIVPGVFLVNGGIMIDEEFAMKTLSTAALRIGIKDSDYLCYSEGKDEAVVMYELIKKGIYIPDEKNMHNHLQKLEEEIFKFQFNYLMSYRKEKYGSDKRILILNGSATVGKDTFVESLSKYVSVRHISMADLAKKALLSCGWNGIKDEASRKALSDIKIALDEFDDCNFKYIVETSKRFLFEYPEFEDVDYLCIDMREPKDIQRFKTFIAAVPAVLVTNERVKHITSNVGDAGVFDYNYDYIIENNGTKEDMIIKAGMLINKLKENSL